MPLVLFFTVISPVFCQTVFPPVSGPPHPAVEGSAVRVDAGGTVSPALLIYPILPVTVRRDTVQVSAPFGFFSSVKEPVLVTEAAKKLVEDSVFWSWMTVGGLGASALSFIIMSTVDTKVGGVLSLLSVGFWTGSYIATAVTHLKISNEVKSLDPATVAPVAAGFASLTGALFGAGALTALGFVFGDTSGVAEISAYVCLGLSALAGGYGVFKTLEYASATGTDVNFY